MMVVYLLQLVLPLVPILWLAILPPPGKVGGRD